MADPIAAVPTPSPTPVPAPLAPQKSRLLDRSFGVASFKYNRWSVDLEENQSVDDVLSEQFWSGQADKIMGLDKTNPKGVGDIIEIRKRDTQQFLEVIVVAIGKGFVRVAPLRMYEPRAIAEPEGSPLTTRWNPGRRCHEVIRAKDREMMASNFQTKQDAVAWIVDHIAKMAA